MIPKRIYANPQREGLLLPADLPAVLEPGDGFEFTIMSGRMEDWVFRATRPSETRELLAHKVRGNYTALNVGRVPMRFMVGEILRIIEFKLVWVPAVIVYARGNGGFVRTATEGQSIDELVEVVETNLGER